MACLLFLACKHTISQSNGNNVAPMSSNSPNNLNSQDDKNQKMSFGRAVHGIFKNNGKYYLAKCASRFNYNYSNNDESSIIELSLNKVVQSCPDHHGRTSYIIDSLGDKVIGVQYESRFNITGDEIVKKGRFLYEVSNRIDTIALYVDGLPINEASAKKHIQKNKFYMLRLAPSNGLIKVGLEKETDCSNKMYEKYGFKLYLIGLCIPSKYHEDQIKAYNNFVFNYLKDNKHFSAENYEALITQYHNGIYKCGVSKWMDENGVGNGKTQKEIWEEVVLKYRKLPESAKSTDSTTFWYNHIRVISEVFDTMDIESPLKLAEKENDYFTKPETTFTQMQTKPFYSRRLSENNISIDYCGYFK